MSLVGDVALVSIDDGKVNALNARVFDGLWEALRIAEDQAKAVVIAGRPGVFSAGLDLNVVQTSASAASELFHRGTEVFLRLAEFPRPVVVACTGHALAAGAVILLCCDVRIGTPGDFKIGLNEVAIGLAIPELVVELAQRRLSRRHFTLACNMAQIYSPPAAVEVGFLDRLGSGDATADAVNAAAELAQRLRPAAFASTREATCRGLTETIMRNAAELLRSNRAAPAAAPQRGVSVNPAPGRR